MARVVFLILIFANLAFFVWTANYLGNGESGREPERLKNDLQADQLIVSAQDVPPPTQVCRRVGPLPLAEAERLKGALEARGGARVAMKPMEEANFWVYMPPLSDDNAVDRKVAELKRLGVTDFFVVTESGEYRNAISLGSFHDEASAQEFFDQLSKKGVRSARIEPRARAAERARLDVVGLATVVDKGLANLAASAPVVDCALEQ